MAPIGSLGNRGLTGEGLSGGGLAGRGLTGGGGSAAPFVLRSVRDYRGRVGAAIPTAGIALPSATGGTKPYTYTLSDRPAGTVFDAATRKITGTPSTAYATRTVTYTATDSATPAVTLTHTFDFPIVAETADMTLDDWDNLGYGMSTRNAEMLMLIEAGDDVPDTGTASARLYRIAPRGAAAGTKIDDPHEDLGITDVEAILTEIRMNNGGGTVLLNDSNTNEAGEAVNFNLGAWAAATDLYFYVKTLGFEISYNHAVTSLVSSGSNWAAWSSSAAQQAMLRTIAMDERIIFAVAAAP